jgi:inosine-uridine nucleoside N-ribohydrolase
MTSSPLPLLVDCDPGNARPGADIDDTVALALLLRTPQVEIRGVTVTAGNMDLEAATEGALTVLDAADRAEIPVHRGAAAPLQGEDGHWSQPVHARRHRGLVDKIWRDYRFIPPNRRADSADAAGFIADQIAESPGQVTVLATGPLTNLAHAIDLLPEFGRLVRRVVVMGGAWLLPDHLQELNFSWDPQAADRVLASGADLTVVPLDVTLRTRLDPATADQMAESASDPLGVLVCDLLGRWVRFSIEALGRDGAALHDPLAAALLLDDQLVTTTRRVAAVDVASRLSPGRLVTWNPSTVFAPTAVLPEREPVTLVTDVDNARLVRLIRDTVPR